MGRIILYMALAMLLCSCNRNSQNLLDQMPSLFPPPITAELNTGEGYRVNPVTGDSIAPVRNSFGDTLLTGVNLPISGKRIDPRMADRPIKVCVGPPEGGPDPETIRGHRTDLATTIGHMDKLIKSIPVNDTTSWVLVTSNGDTIPTGIPIPAIGKSGSCAPRQFVRSGPFRIRENVTANLRYLEDLAGMIGEIVLDIMQDSRGNLWFATLSGGAIMYDGNTFTPFTVKEGLKSNMVRQIFEDSRGNIWFGTQNAGLSRYDGHSITHFTEEGGLGASLINSIMEDREGILWFATNPGGAVRYDGKTFTHFTVKEGLHYYNKDLLSAGRLNIVFQILQDCRGDFWFANVSGGLSMYNGSYFTHFDLDENVPIGPDVMALLEDSKGIIWIASGDGLHKYDGETLTHFTEEDGLSKEWAYALMEDKSGHLWIGTLGGGVYSFDGHSFTHLKEKDELSNNAITSMFEDSYGNLWLGTEGQGVSIYRPGSFHHYKVKEGLAGQITSIMEDKSGKVWFNGLFLKKEEGFVELSDRFLKNTSGGDVFKKLARYLFNVNYPEDVPENFGGHFLLSRFALEDSRGNVWNLLKGPGISRYDGDTVTFFYKEQGLMEQGYVNFIIEDRKGNLWMDSGGPDGICMYDGVAFTHFTEKEGLSSNNVTAVIEDSRGNLWIAAGGRGVSRFDGERITHFTEREGLGNNDVTSVMEDSHGNMWFGSRFGGITVFDGESFTYITETEGLSHNGIGHILEDRNHRVWVGTQNGLNCIVMDPGNRKGADQFRHMIIHTFMKEDGLVGTQLGPIYTGKNDKVAFLDSRNRMWWSTDQGLCMLEMNEFTLPADPPSHVKMTSLDLNGQLFDYRRLPDSVAMKVGFDSMARFFNYPMNLKLPYRLNHLTFHLSAIDWAAPHKIKYSYQIGGLDKSWSKPSTEPVADYRNLPSGTHTLYVRAIGAAQKWSETFEYTFTIRPPWWFAWWAYVIYALMLLAIVDQYRRYLLRRAKLRSAVEIERFEKEKVLEMDQMKSRFFANISHEFRTPLALILGPVEELMKKKGNDVPMKRDDLGMIRRNAKRLQLLINQILDISRLETGKIRLRVSSGNITDFVRRIVLSFLSLAESKKIVYEYDLPESPEPLFYDADKLEKILTNLISNAFKFTPRGGKIKIILEYRDGTGSDAVKFAQISIEDSGIGIAADQIEKIFDRFYQVGSSDTREYEGTGIGLALTKELVGIYRGELQLTSEPGKGSLFTVTVPVSGNLFQPEEISDSNPTIMEEAASADDAIAAGTVVEKEVVPEEDDQKESNRPVILIVEDNSDLRQYISRNLNEEYHIVEAENGREGLNSAIEEIPDLIITDLMMPEMDGIELCEKIRTDRATSHIPIVMLTARADKESKLKGLKTGADDYLIKPFDADELQARVRNLIWQRRFLKEKYQEEFVQTDPFTKEIPDLRDDFIAAVIKCILTHLGEPEYGVDQLARDVGFSRSQLYRKLLSMTGYVPSKFIRNVRLKQSARLFHEGHKNITQVLYTVGFNSPSHFAQSFRELYGMNPSEYLKQTFGSKG